MSLTYSEYLHLPDLLGQRRPQSAEHDELLFITIHQACELWFRQIITELTAARDGMLDGQTYVPRQRLRRCHAIERMLAGHFDVLDTMSPPDFLRFRNVLGTASGAQSAQFGEIEALSSENDCGPSVWDGFLAVLAKAGFATCSKQDRAVAYQEIARNREDHESLWELAEALIDHDQAWSMFRCRHLLIVERQIGRKPGTAGTSGASALARRDRFYPELWELRSFL
jgi:tryptophan 2,3-dioxygenase